MNEGKKFEDCFNKSIPKEYFCYRLRDAGGWSDATNLRFTSSNMCDFIMYAKGRIFLLELKSVKENSLSYSNIGKIENGVIKKTSILAEEYKKEGVVSGYLINYRGANKTYFVSADKLADRMLNNTKKSLNLKECEEIGVFVEQTLKRVNYVYNVEKFIEEV